MVVVLMGVAGSGKTTVGRLVAERLDWEFYDGDDFHPPANVEKMSRGEPLTDTDRAPWLQRLRELIAGALAAERPIVLACSALRKSYRERLAVDPARTRFVYLRGTPELIVGRLEARLGHFAKPDLLESQFATLEEPTDALIVDVSQPLDRVVELVARFCQEP